ncbi:hydrogenase maturation protease [Nonomuraea roseoviolacea]|uniref:Hydrogenase maturation protease n=1 Tax=Nonomuraea roseoviolacea subsp. carminata TaxID=160689 RepID=A0ABT1KB02_9ACTN|nr:hydrogenase maturation protease [Nonomuraea roseoviolacea]MCP2351185.1 hydrogenase maturation protease [Nonomuraea roseoviolacea subsp. carminata]
MNGEYPGPGGDRMVGLGFWARMERRGPGVVTVAGRAVRAGSRVRLRPSPMKRTDIMDLVLDGRVAVVESVEQDDEGAFHVAVTLDDDPGRDLGEARMPGHRFFYAADEIEPLDERDGAAPAARILVAGIGNVFFGDDGFGVEVARRLSALPLPAGVDVVDFGIRGMDLAYALQRDYDLAILVDAAPRGQAPGTLTVLEPDLSPDAGAGAGDGAARPAAQADGHGMDPVKVLRLAAELGRLPGRVVVVCCEPAVAPSGEPDEDVLVELSAPVREAAGHAVRLVMDMIAENAGPASRPPHPEGGDMA